MFEQAGSIDAGWRQARWRLMVDEVAIDAMARVSRAGVRVAVAIVAGPAAPDVATHPPGRRVEVTATARRVG